MSWRRMCILGSCIWTDVRCYACAWCEFSELTSLWMPSHNRSLYTWMVAHQCASSCDASNFVYVQKLCHTNCMWNFSLVHNPAFHVHVSCDDVIPIEKQSPHCTNHTWKLSPLLALKGSLLSTFSWMFWKDWMRNSKISRILLACWQVQRSRENEWICQKQSQSVTVAF